MDLEMTKFQLVERQSEGSIHTPTQVWIMLY